MFRFLLMALALAGIWLVASDGMAQTVSNAHRIALQAEENAERPVSVAGKPARLSIEGVSLVTAIERLAERADVLIAYSPTRLSTYDRVTCRCEGLTVGEALDTLLAGTAFRYMEVQGHIVVARRALGQPPRTEAVRHPAPRIENHHLAVTTSATTRRAPAVQLRSEDTGAVVGQVFDASTDEPLASVDIHLEGTNHRTLTNEEGRYIVTGVRPGTYNVVARFIGYGIGREENLRVVAGETVQLDFRLSITPLSLQQIVVTGLMDPTSGDRAPFVVGRVSADDIAVPSLDIIGALRGRVAGIRMSRGGGQPGDDYDVILRTPTSIMRSNRPMVVVDGIILGDASLRDFDGLDIESIEVVKGAAAASMYGSRAAPGVIAITTQRGGGLEQGETRFSFRSEAGIQAVPPDRIRRIPQYHPYLTNEDGEFVNHNGEVVDPVYRVVKPDAISDVPYQQTFDHFGSLIRRGLMHTNTVSMSQNAQDTRFYASARNTTESGIMRHNDGLGRQSFRVNLDHWATSELHLGVTAYYGRSSRDDVADPNPFYDVMMMPPDVDLTLPDEEKRKRYIAIPQRGMHTRTNPLYVQYYNDAETHTSRFIGGLTAEYSPSSWLRFNSNVGFDRSDRETFRYWPVGFEQMLTETRLFGEIQRRHRNRRTASGNFGARILHQVGALTLRHHLRAVYELEGLENTTAIGRDLAAENTRSLDVASELLLRSNTSHIRSEGYSIATGFDYGGKLIGDVLFRIDGSSLFGPDDRWNPYYRASAAYRMAEEEWWPFEGITEFKPRFSIGTAGGLPRFSDRYETWTVREGEVRKHTLGNRLLRPEKATERELGLDVVFRDRVSLQLTRAESKVEDQLLPIPIPHVIGYSHQWNNAGTLEGTTYEATLEAALIARRDRGWSVSMTWDRSSHMITEFPFACYTDSPTGSASRDVFYRCAGYSLTAIYDRDILRGHGQLSAVHANSHGQFQVNDDGFLVPVGEGNNWTDGVAKGLWGTTVEIDDRLYEWGMPIYAIDDEGDPLHGEIGNSEPDFDFGLGTNVRIGNFSFGGLIDGSVGGLVYNYERRRAYQDFHPDFDQGDKPEDLKKPVHYYSAQVGRVAPFIEDGTYMKLRELAGTYRFDVPGFLAAYGVSRTEISVMARNLYTWTRYTGWDPEVGTLHRRIREGAYPHMRTLSVGLRVDF